MSALRRRRSLAFMACPPDDFPRLLAELQRIEPGGAWDLVAFYPPPCDVPPGTRVVMSTSSARVAARLWMTSLVHRVERVVVCCHDLTQPSALQSLVEFVSAFPVRDRVMVDSHGSRGTIARANISTLIGLLALPPLLFIATTVTRVGLRAAPSLPGRAQNPAWGRKTAILLPILPDLSHTFVYREALALKQRHPEYLIVSLEQGDSSVVHSEAAALLAQTRFVPHLSPARYLLWYLRAWCRRPAAMAALIRFLQPHTAEFGAGWIADDAFSLLRLEHLHHSNYLMRGFVLAEFLRKQDVGYVHVYGSTYPSVRMLVAHQLHDIPYSISTFVDFDYVTPFHMLDAKFGQARFVVTCTRYCAERLSARLPGLASKFRVLHHALPADYARAPGIRRSDGRSRLVYVGRFVPKKGLDSLVQACALLRDRGTAFTCHLYGAGDERARLAQLVTTLGLADRVVFEGPIPNEQFYSTMNEDDVFVCPSRYMPDGERDGIPVTLLEAMAAGLTVVSTPVSGIPELIVDGVNGYLVPPDAPQALADCLQALLDSREKRAAVRAGAIHTIQRGFAIEQSAAVLDAWISQENGSRGETGPPATAPRRGAA